MMQITETEKMYLLMTLADSISIKFEEGFRLTKKKREDMWLDICIRNDEIKRISGIDNNTQKTE